MSSRPYNFKKDKFPLRVIHIDDTLANNNGGICFTEPTNWEFHVLSHTWTEDIRNLSSTIGQSLSNQCLMTGGDVAAYNEALRSADFKSERAYIDLRELLSLLAEERVERIWIDVLCIDQTNGDHEKKIEIPRMAAYYCYSKGCYALMHGIGQGYALWRPGSAKEIPRWFERVWTLQEFILPQSITFIVEGLDEKLVCILNQLIAKHSLSDDRPPIGLCKCCIPLDLLERRPSSIADMCRQNAELSAPPYNYIQHGHRNRSDDHCLKCGYGALFRTTSRPRSAPLELLHFVDSEAFLLVARAGLLIDTGSRCIKNWGYEETLSRMYRVVEGKANTRQILSAIGERYCSVQEDRVLSILGVLGVKEDDAIQPGATLDQQVVRIASLCDPCTIIELCATDARGYSVPGMSWAPNFRDNWDRYREGWMKANRAAITLDQSWTGSDMKTILPKAEVREVNSTGIRLSCRMVEACMKHRELFWIMFVGDQRIVNLQASTWQNCVYSDDTLEHEPQVTSRVQDENFKGIYFRDAFDIVRPGYPSLIYLTVASDVVPDDVNKSSWEDFNVWLVLLGCYEEHGRSLVMVCVGDSEKELHKVGMLSLTDSEMVQLNINHPRECVIGGFGQDLSKYLNLSHHNKGESSSSCPQEKNLFHIPLTPIFDWTPRFLIVSYSNGGEPIGTHPIIFPYGIAIPLNLELPHIKQLLHRYLMDASALPGVTFGLDVGMSKIIFYGPPTSTLPRIGTNISIAPTLGI